MTERVIGKPFKKGQSGNPGGRSKTPKHIKKLRELTTEEIKQIGDVIVLGTRADLKAVLENPETNALQAWIAAIAVKGISKGDMHSLNELLNRLVGKVTDKVDAKHHYAIDQMKQIESMTTQELIAATQSAIEMLKEEDGG